MTAHHPGFSDRIAHALAFAAKHGASSSRRGGSITWPTRPANVAVILARYGCDEPTIVAGVLAALLNEVEPERQRHLIERLQSKFDTAAMEAARQVVEPRLDARGRPRGWEAYKLDFLANLALADQRALDVCAANEIFQCGVLMTDVRRLGIEYLASYAPGGPSAVLRWFSEVVTALEGHPTGPRSGMLAELRDLTGRLAADIASA
jgi:hypothetical protein